MKKYIERDAALKNQRWNGRLDEYVVFVRDIEAIPAADVVELKHGENIGKDYAECDQFVCSECGIELQNWYRVERDMDDGEETHHEYVMRHCPNCGAKMDGGAE